MILPFKKHFFVICFTDGTNRFYFGIFIDTAFLGWYNPFKENFMIFCKGKGGFMRKIQSLNGIWDYRIGLGEYTKKTVPYSDLCVGISECRRTFDALKQDGRAFVVFEAITYRARVSLNGKFVAELYPYIEYRLEITHLLKEKDNLLTVEICDTGMSFGPSAGWENYSGIIRDVYVEYTSESMIKDAFWHTDFGGDYSKATCFVDFEIDGKKDDTYIHVLLKDKDGKVVSQECSEGEKAEFTVENPKLWSPDSPYLYTLQCTLFCDGKEVDSVSKKVGFKEFCAKGRQLYLNGERFFLLGVNKHDLFGEEGHTYGEEKLRKDLTMIKETGCNFVRLVHYPHTKKAVEIADEIGLLVSEEPGLWWSDMHNKETCIGALTVLEGVIRRDRSNASIAFWLCFNECRFTLEFLMDACRVARKTDPYHMVSGANCMNFEMTKENYLKCGFDFYTMHPYAPDTSLIKKSAEYFTELPLVFTEWGGYHCDRNERLFSEFINTIIDLSKNPEDKPSLAGAVYWEWAETYDFNRGVPACVDGVIHEGLVDMNREPTHNLEVFKREFSKLFKKDDGVKYELSVKNLEVGENASAVDISSLVDDKGWQAVLDDSRRHIKDYDLRGIREITYGPVLPEKITEIGKIKVNLSTRPVVVLDEEMCVDIGKSAGKIYIVGNTSMPVGYPIESEYGEDVIKYTIEYTDGTTDEHILENGHHITTATTLHGSSRMNPVAAKSDRAIVFSYDKNWEQYIVNVGVLEADGNKTIKCIRFRRLDGKFLPLIYGISVE